MHPNAIPTNPTKRKIERAAFSATVVPSRRRALVDPLERVADGRLERAGLPAELGADPACVKVPELVRLEVVRDHGTREPALAALHALLERVERGDEGHDEARDQRAADGKVLPEQRHHLHDLAECHRRVRAQIPAARFAALYARMWASATSRTSR